MRMKIGILTHHYVKNYGAFLQAKALYETVRALYPEADVRFINYINLNHYFRNVLHVLRVKPGKRMITSAVNRFRQLSMFSEYERQLPVTSRVHNAEEIMKLDLDLIIVGSDEVWRINGTGYHPLKYGCGINHPDMICYAPSVGDSTEGKDIPENLSSGLKNFRKHSCRDQKTMEFLYQQTGIRAPIMPDPVFLYDFENETKKYMLRQDHRPYILIYDCKLTEMMIQELREFAEEKGMLIVGAGSEQEWYDRSMMSCNPYEWISLFRNAELVITGTFHGTAFSVKYGINAVCYPTENNRIDKIRSLLESIHMEECLLSMGNETDFVRYLHSKRDFTKARAMLAEMKGKALEFLKN